MRNVFCALALLGCVAAAVGEAAIIDFDGVSSGTVVTNQYPGVVFSSEAGLVAAAYAYLGPSPFGPPNVLVPYNAAFGFPTSVPDLYVDFTTPVNGLSFLAVAADEFGVVARVNVYSGVTLLGTDNIIGTAAIPGTFGNGSTVVNLSAYANVTRIEIVPPAGQFDLDSAYGGGGLIYDNFSFDPVPEPGVGLVSMAAAAAAAAGGTRRRARRAC